MSEFTEGDQVLTDYLNPDGDRYEGEVTMPGSDRTWVKLDRGNELHIPNERLTKNTRSDMSHIDQLEERIEQLEKDKKRLEEMLLRAEHEMSESAIKRGRLKHDIRRLLEYIDRGGKND